MTRGIYLVHYMKNVGVIMGLKNFDGNVDVDYLRETARVLEVIKNKSYEMMKLTTGDSALDIGCGPGIDVCNISKLVGENGKVIGLDKDENMLLEAKKNYKENNVEFIYGDVSSIPYAEEYFNAVRAERLFQVLPDSYKIEELFKELVRVTKKNGRIVLVDTDWGSASIDYEDNELTNRLLYFFANKCRPNGFAGRQFYSLLKSAGMCNIEIEIKPIITLDFNETPFSAWLTKEALDNNIATKEEMEQWNKVLEEKTEKKEFFSSVNMIVISGEKVL